MPKSYQKNQKITKIKKIFKISMLQWEIAIKDKFLKILKNQKDCPNKNKRNQMQICQTRIIIRFHIK